MLSMIQGIYQVGKAVYDTAQVVTANKVRCQRLSERVQLVIKSLKKLESMKESKAYAETLTSLKSCLNECLEFISDFKEDRNWFMEAYRSSKVEKKFQDLSEHLARISQQLALEVDIQQLMDREQDQKDMQRDNDYLVEQSALIVELNKMALRKLQALEMKLDMRADENKMIIDNIVRKQGEAILDEIKHLQSSQSVAQPVVSTHQPPIDPKYEVSYQDISFGQRLTQGSFGNIYLGKWSGQTVVVKAVEEKLGEAEIEEFIREVKIMSQLHHGNIVAFYGACIKPTRLCLVMEYMERGSLDKLLAKSKFNPTQQKQLALDIAYGLRYLHGQGVFHRDLKSGNVLVDARGKAKITDFGLSKTKSTSVKSIQKKTESIAWQSPECFKRGNVYDAKADIYSFGVILWEIMTGQKPFAGYKGDLMDYVGKGNREKIPSAIPQFYQKLIQACWDQNPRKRPAIDELIQQLENDVCESEVKQTNALQAGEAEYKKGTQFEKSKQYVEAYAEYKKSAQEGYGKAFTNIGFFHLVGRGGVEQNKDRARQYFIDGAKKGHTRAMVNLGMMYEKGDGVAKDLSQALQWYKQAADAKDPDGIKFYEALRKTTQGHSTTIDSSRASSSSSSYSPSAGSLQEGFKKKLTLT